MSGCFWGRHVQFITALLGVCVYRGAGSFARVGFTCRWVGEQVVAQFSSILRCVAALEVVKPSFCRSFTQGIKMGVADADKGDKYVLELGFKGSTA